jgi:hypothetical protein
MVEKIGFIRIPLIGWVIVVGCIGKSSVRKVTNPSTILALDGLTWEFPWDMSEGFGTSHCSISGTEDVNRVL